MKSFDVALKGLHRRQTKERFFDKEIGTSSLRKTNRYRRRNMKCLNERMRQLKVEANEIKEDQERIKGGQKIVREKFEAIQIECEQLRKETALMTIQSLKTQLRLGLMFQILRARESNDFNKAASLTQVLRELVAKPNN